MDKEERQELLNEMRVIIREELQNYFYAREKEIKDNPSPEGSVHAFFETSMTILPYSLNAGYRLTPQTVYEFYEAFCDARNTKPINPKKFHKEAGRLGAQIIKSGTNYYRNVAHR
jgi:hypothetical protein